MRHDMGGDSSLRRDAMQGLANLRDQGWAAVGTGKQKWRRCGGWECAQELQAGNHGSDLVIDRRPAVVVHLSQRHMQGPAIAWQMTETVGGKIRGFANPH